MAVIGTARPATGRHPSFVALMMVTGTTALSTDTYISALPDVQRSLGTTASAAQLTLTTCIAGMAVGQLLTGPVSDSRGRRRLILAAVVVFTITSALCALATADWVLIGLRAVQGMACGAAAALGRAVVSDVWTGREAAAKFGTLSALGLIAPVAGPAIGSVLLRFGSWRLIFGFLAVVGVAMIVSAVLGLPETLPRSRRHPGGLRQLGRRTRSLLTDRAFAVPVAVNCLTTCGFFIYIGGSSFVLQQGSGLSQQQYALLFGTNAAVMMASSVVFRSLVRRTGPGLLRRIAMIIQTTAVVALVVVSVLTAPHVPPLPVVWCCLAAMTAGLGSYLPANAAICQQAGRRYGGTASALGGGLPFLAGSLTTPLTGVLRAESVLAMSAGMAFFFACAATAAIGLRQKGLSDATEAEADRHPAQELARES